MPGAVPAGRRRTGARAEPGSPLTAPGFRVLCAPNAFKGSLTAAEAAIAMGLGVEDAGGTASAMPVADGGDGTLDVLIAAAGDAATISHHRVSGPLDRPVQARIGWLGDDRAVVEMAEAAGLRLLGPAQRDPMRATSRGAGELILAALQGGARQVIVGVGGSACSDGGAGILQALGARLADRGGVPIGPGAAGLAHLDRIDTSAMTSLSGLVSVACDVRNPLLGPDGAAAVFAAQKGATPDQRREIEAALRRFRDIAVRDCGAAGLDDVPGAGAAGGAGFGLLLAGADLRPGAPLVCDVAGLTVDIVAQFDLVLSGEGRLDAQTSFGKAPAEVARRAAAAAVPAAAVAGAVADPLPALFTAAVGLNEVTTPDTDTRAEAAVLVRAAAALAVRRALHLQRKERQ